MATLLEKPHKTKSSPFPIIAACWLPRALKCSSLLTKMSTQNITKMFGDNTQAGRENSFYNSCKGLPWLPLNPCLRKRMRPLRVSLFSLSRGFIIMGGVTNNHRHIPAASSQSVSGQSVVKAHLCTCIAWRLNLGRGKGRVFHTS